MCYHTAILERHYLDLILSGQKRIECRLTRIPCPPFRRIATNETVLLKESSGPVRGEVIVKKVEFFDNLCPDKIARIRSKYNDQIMAVPDFWESRSDCRWCTLIWFRNIRAIVPYRIKRRGMQACWCIRSRNRRTSDTGLPFSSPRCDLARFRSNHQ